jgi:hypothetical protein
MQTKLDKCLIVRRQADMQTKSDDYLRVGRHAGMKTKSDKCRSLFAGKQACKQNQTIVYVCWQASRLAHNIRQMSEFCLQASRHANKIRQMHEHACRQADRQTTLDLQTKSDKCLSLFAEKQTRKQNQANV